MSYRICASSVLLALAVICSPHAALGQVADYYRGTVVNDDFTGQPADLELFIFDRTDSTTAGWMQVGAPLGGSGITSVVARNLDSLYLITVTATADTLVWASPRRTGILEGRYWIRGPNSAGQGGRWRLLPQTRISPTALTLFAICAGALCVLLIAALSVAGHQRWWAWRSERVSPTAEERGRLNGVGGWLAWIVFWQLIIAVYLLATAHDTAGAFGGPWMLDAAIPGMRVALFIEGTAHSFQLFGIVLGIVLIWRRSALAPPYWVAMLLLSAGFAITDLVLGDMLFRADFARQLAAWSSSGAARNREGMQEATAQNIRMVMNAAVWSLYWLRSRRVFVVFGPTPQMAIAPVVAASPSSEELGPEHPTTHL